MTAPLRGSEQSEHAMAESKTNGTIPAPVERTASGRFARGNRLGGRPKGSRNKLSEAFLRDFHAVWLKKGKKSLERVADEDPQTFVRVAAVILPRAMEVDGALVVTHRDEFAIEVRDFREAYEKWGQVIGAQMPLIEHRPIDEDDTEPDEH